MESAVKQRLIEFLQYKKISQAKFEQLCNLSNGYVNNIKKSLGIEKLQNILCVFPELNREWLLYGKGKMIISEQEIEVPQSEESAEMQILKIKLQAQEEKIKSYERELERITNDQTRLLDMLEKLVNRKSD